MRHPPPSPFVLAGLLALAAGCFGVADPMPSPDAPDGGDILVSSSSALGADGPVDVVGLIGLEHAVAKVGFVVLRQPLTQSVTVVRSGKDGTFAAVLAASAGDRIEVSFEESADGPESDPIEVGISQSAQDSPGTPNAGTGGTTSTGGSVAASAPVASPPDGQGRTHVTGTDLVPGQVAAVGNVRTGEVQTVTVPADGQVDVALAAAFGDTILVIVRDPGSDLTSQVASLTVPRP